MNFKKYAIIALMTAFSSNAFSQTQVCNDAVATEVISGSLFGTLIRATGCGGTTLFCINAENDVDSATSNRFYAAALTAQATGSTLDIRFDFNQSCGGNGNTTFPQVIDLRVNSQ